VSLTIDRATSDHNDGDRSDGLLRSAPAPSAPVLLTPGGRLPLMPCPFVLRLRMMAGEIAVAFVHVANAVVEVALPASLTAIPPLVAPPREPTLFDLRLVGHRLPPEAGWRAYVRHRVLAGHRALLERQWRGGVTRS